MLIQQLSSKAICPQASILSAPPDSDSFPYLIYRTLSQAEMIWFASDTPVVVDYESGMSVIVLGCPEESYYLDRVLLIEPNVRFGIRALSDLSTVRLHMQQPQSPELPPESLPEAGPGTACELSFQQLYTAFYQECARDFYFRGEQHEAYELVYVDRGKLHNLVAGQDILLHQGQLLLIGQNQWHTQYADEAVSFLTLSFLAHSSALAAISGRAFSPTARASELLAWILEEREQRQYAYDCTESLTRLLLIELLRSAQEQIVSFGAPLPATRDTEQRMLDQVLQIICASISHKLTLQQLADSVHVSTAYLYRLFRAQLGMSPGAYITKLRIDESKLLLREGRLSMGELAKEMGFSSQQHFSRQFRSVTGMTPTEYVRTLR